MALSPQWLDELRARVTLSSVIMRTTKLQRAGREWKACCPFHNEKTPSFTVSDEKGFYHCFGCGAHGDVIRWMTDQRGLPFMDAVKELAEQAGMEVPRPDPREAQRAEKRASLVDVMEAAQQWFVDSLHGAGGETAREYLRSRGFTRRIVQQFGFGYAPDSKVAMKGALSQFEEPMLVEGGLLISVDDKPPYDRFRDRLMLPIQDARGRVIAFGGRILESRDGVAKYLNSPDTPLFDKGRTLYNLHRAGPASRQTDRVVVVEGYMDVIALANAGIEDAVAPLGTALTEHQLELLWRMVDVPVLCFDGDNAGQRAAMRAISRALPMLRPGKSLGIVRLPAGLDPDDLIRQRGAATMEKLLAEPGSLLETLWQFEREAEELRTPEDKAGLKARLLNHVDAIEHGDIKALYRRELLERYSAFAFPPRPQREWKSGGAPARPVTSRLSGDAAARLQKALSGGARDALASAVIHGLLRHPGEIARHTEALGRLARLDPKTTVLVESLFEVSETLDSRDNVAISVAQGLPAPPDLNRYAFLREGTDPVDAREELAEAVSLLVERPALKVAIAAATSRFDEDPEGSIAEQNRLRQRLAELNERLKTFGRKKAANAADLEFSQEAADEPVPDLEMD
ncbi:DNA primase [Altererythrobacter arenosus]|uniref:DNA primase n=1 Tax=Altererythrobacter arenosus TaxID=3032592 RepID=A0ABY8FPN6_9SPHN|nr:DNA primase [Altererythrobacter sp. CAU 1644]WFL76973.1 DNA primase [Altererythrobacter sp. CAU 1644]